MTKYHRIRASNCVVGMVLVLLLIAMANTASNGGLLKPVQATTKEGLGIWNSASSAPTVLNTTATMNTFVVFTVNATGGTMINGFDINATWDPTILNFVNSTLKGGIFDRPDFQSLVSQGHPGSIERAGDLLGGARIPGTGVVFKFTLRVVSAIPGSSSIHIAKGLLTLPTVITPVLMDGYFSNLPSNNDLLLTSMSVTNEKASVGDIVGVSVGVRNIGAAPMTNVVVTLTYNGTLPINSTTVGTVAGNSIKTAAIVWNTTTYSLGLYTLNATVTTSSADAFSGDNSLLLEQVTLVTHDVAVTSLTAPPRALVNTTVPLSVVLKNLGTVEDNASVTILANSTIAATGSFPLNPGSTSTVSLGWNTTGATLGHYTLVAIVQPVPGERNLTNNIFVDGNITIKKFFDHDLAIVGSLPTNGRVGQDFTLSFVVVNRGLLSENYTVRVLLDTQIIFQSPKGLLAAGTNVTVSFPTWSTQSLTPGSYTLSVNVTSTSNDENLSNNQISTQFLLNPNRPPTASYTISPTVPGPTASVKFNATMSFDPDGDPLTSYSWSFGDNSANQTGTIVNHTYASSGSYTVTLTVMDVLGAKTNLQKQLRVNSLPVANFTISPTAPQAGSQVTFDASSSADTDGTISSYAWSFGDGLAGAGKTATHIYGSSGTFTVKLTVTDNDGGIKEYSSTLDVSPAQGVAPIEIYAIAGAAVAIAGIATWFVLSRRRKSKPISTNQKKP